MAKSRADIEADVRDVLVDALGVDEDDVVPTATLKGDLGAESIDYLDIVFRLEKKFSTPEKPFKIAQGELFPENLMTDPSLVEGGKVTAKGIALLKEKVPRWMSASSRRTRRSPSSRPTSRSRACATSCSAS